MRIQMFINLELSQENKKDKKKKEIYYQIKEENK